MDAISLESLKYALAGPQTQIILVVVILFGAFPLLCWRLWRFTILPHMRPGAPDELPYLIPGLGHTLSFFKDFNKTIDNARAKLKDPNSIFSVNVAGQRIYICSSPEDADNLYRNDTTISYYIVIRDMYHRLGISRDGLRKLFKVNSAAKHDPAAATRPPIPAAMAIEFQGRQNKPGELQDATMKCFKQTMAETLHGVQEGSSTCVIRTTFPMNRSGGSSHLVSIFSLASNLFLEGSATAFLGAKIWQVNPNFTDTVQKWERTNWKFIFHIPNFLSKDMLQVRDDLTKTYLDYLAIPKEERSDASFLVKSIESAFIEAGISLEDQARVFVLQFWISLANVYKVGFWALTYLVYNQSVLHEIYLEVQSAVVDGEIVESHLAQRCPLLSSFLNEILRLTSESALFRLVIKPTQLGSKTLEAGSKIMVPYRQLHKNKAVWGQDPSLMVADRFVKQPKLASSKSYRPFGGGVTLCPGRLTAKRVIFYAIASILTKFELHMDVEATRRACGGKGILPDHPKQDTTKANPGASLPLDGQDVFVWMTPRVLKPEGT